MSITIEEVALPSQALSGVHSTLIANGLANAPQGVTEWSTTVSGMFDASNNVGVIALTDGKLQVNHYVRAFSAEKIDDLGKAIDDAWEIGTSAAETRHFGGYLPWSPSPTSLLLTFAQETYLERFGKKISLQIVGGGLELSEFSVKYPEMQFLSFGPTIHDPHTTNETVEISSIEPCWQFLVKLLKNIEQVD